MRNVLIKVLPWLTGLGVLVELLSLRLGLLNAFFFDAMHADVQGIDYFSLPRGFLNLVAGKSMYDTFSQSSYGSHATMYLAHPALAPLLGSWLSRFDAMTSYGVYTMLSLAIMAACAWLLSRQTDDALMQRLIWFLMLTAFPTYWMLFVGNVQAVLVLAIGMVFAGVLAMTYRGRGETLLLAGLLLSLLSKPVVLLMFPALLLVKETRRSAVRALAVYAIVSVVFEVVPALNPEAIGLGRVAWLAGHPGYVRATMNIYANHFQLNADMKDNSIHWFNLIAQTGTRFVHIDVFSLPVFLDVLTGTRTPAWIYQMPALAVLGLSLLVGRMRQGRPRLEALLLLLMAVSISFFLAYPTTWEYQYTSVLPVAGVLLALRGRDVFYERARPWLFSLAACAWLPSLYWLVEGETVTARVLLTIWADRVLPVTMLFFLAIALVARFSVRPEETS
ncbi:hypothetical protein [Granulicella paludicola]|uniref:hypothetical protein n=1 Tax=Granulicella paludicola TaxID=474951 RepID=UPI0021DFE180|nr:hypothetical protein [Granulicella paludicola]